MTQPRLRRARQLSKEAFDKLLAWLHPDRDRAAERYEMLRQKVMFYLRHHADPETLADDVFDIVGAKLAAGECIEKDSFFLKVARGRWSDARRRDGRSTSLDVILQRQQSGETPIDRLQREEEDHLMLAAMRRLPPEERILYVQCVAKRLPRRQLAERYQLSESALNTRVHRTRRKLQQYLEEELERTARR